MSRVRRRVGRTGVRLGTRVWRIYVIVMGRVSEVFVSVRVGVVIRERMLWGV
jgi:hypothetical protein